MPPLIVGRDAELSFVRAFLAGVPNAASSLALEGEAGMGKTTLWEAGVQLAGEEGHLVLCARPSESETALSFSALGDLLERTLEEVLAPLPPVQRRALSRALVLDDEEGPASDAHAVGVSVLNAIRSLAAQRSLVVAIDDVQWLDAASAAALGYASRRLRDEPVGVLVARRVPLASSLLAELRRSLPADRYRQLEVGAMPVAALHAVIRDHLDMTLPRPLLVEVHQASAGNPFFALEIVRTLRRTGVAVEVGQPIPVPDTLHGLVHGRLLALPSESREYLLAAAAHAHPKTAVVEAASGVSRAQGLPPALEAGIVELVGTEIRFTHPLLAAGAYEVADPVRRAEVHAHLAELLTDPEARAWQLAASVDEPDAGVATVLEDAAWHARARGAPRPAALLLDRSKELTPPERSVDATRRAVDAAYLHYESGDSSRAEAQLDGVIVGLAPGRVRARALMRLGRVRAYGALSLAAQTFEQAINEAEGDAAILAVAHEGVATCLFRLHERLDESVEHAELASAYALELGDEALAAEALGTQWVVETLLGRKGAAKTGERALQLQPATEGGRILAQPRFARAAGPLWWAGALAESRSELIDLLGRASEFGDESSRPLVLAQLAQVECDLGELEIARERALEGQELAEQSGQHTVFAFNLALEGLAEARLGRAERARALLERALELVPETGGRQAEEVARAALGQLELSRGDPAAVIGWTGDFLDFLRVQGVTEPCALLFVTDLVEALVELGRIDEAVERLDWYEGNARRFERNSALANCARCRGLLAAQAGDLEGAIRAFGKALEWHERVDLPLDRGRTLLVLGVAQRRQKRRRQARETLAEALAVFERIGAALWADRARSELKRISGRAATPGALTPAEQRVAALVAEGKTNKEVAAALFLSDRTVEGHLARIFGKLGIRHRAEVGSVLAARRVERAAQPTEQAPRS